MLTGFTRLKSFIKRYRTRRAEALELAEFLHRSGAWHCGCVECRGESASLWLLLGETIHLSEEERARLRGVS